MITVRADGTLLVGFRCHAAQQFSNGMALYCLKRACCAAPVSSDLIILK